MYVFVRWDLRIDRNGPTLSVDGCPRLPEADRTTEHSGLLRKCMLPLIRRSSRWLRFHSTLTNNTGGGSRWLG